MIQGRTVEPSVASLRDSCMPEEFRPTPRRCSLYYAIVRKATEGPRLVASWLLVVFQVADHAWQENQSCMQERVRAGGSAHGAGVGRAYQAAGDVMLVFGRGI